jgi:hypothetical protein
LFLVFLAVASVTLAHLTQAFTQNAATLPLLMVSGCGFAFSIFCMIWMVKRAVSAFEGEVTAK